MHNSIKDTAAYLDLYRYTYVFTLKFALVKVGHRNILDKFAYYLFELRIEKTSYLRFFAIVCQLFGLDCFCLRITAIGVWSLNRVYGSDEKWSILILE